MANLPNFRSNLSNKPDFMFFLLFPEFFVVRYNVSILAKGSLKVNVPNFKID